MRRGALAGWIVIVAAGCGEAASESAPALQTPLDAHVKSASSRSASDRALDAVVSEPPVAIDGDASDKPSWRGTFRVSVISAADRLPVTGAVVTIHPYSDSTREMAWGEPPREALTDPDGATDAALWTSGVELVVRKRGFLRASVTPRAENWWTEGVEVPLTPAEPLDGRVVLAGSGVPVAEASVFVWADDSGDDVDQVVTDAKGAFAIPGVPPDRPVHVAATLSGFAPAQGVSSPGTRERALVLELGGGATITGTVTDSKGTAASDVEIFVFPRGDTPPDRDAAVLMRPAALVPRAFADAEGRWRIEGLPVPAAYFAFARTADGAEGSSAVVETQSAQTFPGADVVVLRPGSVAIAIVGPGGTPLADKDVDWVTLDGEWGDVPDEAKGHFDDETAKWIVESVAPGSHHVRVETRGVTAVDVPVEVREGARADVSARLERGLSLSGVVRDETGAPVADAFVDFDAVDAPGHPSRNATATTDAQGTFTLTGLPPGAGGISVYAEGFQRWERERGGTPGEKLDPIVLRRAPSIVGRLPAARLGDGLHAGWRQGEHGSSSHDDQKEGTIRLTGFASDVPFEFFIATNHGAPFVRKDVRLAAGEVLDLGEIAFQQGVTVEGVLTGDDGKPIRGASVHGCDWWVSDRESLTGDDGRWRLGDLAPLPTWLWIDADGWPRTLVRVDPVERPSLDVHLTHGGVLTGQCTKKGGGVFPKGHVDAIRVDIPGIEETWDVPVDSLGRFRTSLPAGRYRLDFHARGSAVQVQAAPASITIRDGDEVSAEITVTD